MQSMTSIVFPLHWYRPRHDEKQYVSRHVGYALPTPQHVCIQIGPSLSLHLGSCWTSGHSYGFSARPPWRRGKCARQPTHPACSGSGAGGYFYRHTTHSFAACHVDTVGSAGGYVATVDENRLGVHLRSIVAWSQLNDIALGVRRGGTGSLDAAAT